MSDIVIPGRFNGPPGSANGGYTCGLLATALGASAAVVTLRQPPPVERQLRLSQDQGTATLHDGDTLVAEANESEPDDPRIAVDLPAPVSFADASDAAAQFDVERYAAQHPFPTCFTCGPRRPEDDGLHLFPAATDRRVVVWPWTPDPALVGVGGLVEPRYMWAAMDCPSGLSSYDPTIPWETAVLGRMAAVVRRRPAPGEQLVVAGWPISTTGRKRSAGSVVWGRDGEVLAHNRATWIQLDEEQHAAFQAHVSRG